MPPTNQLQQLAAQGRGFVVFPDARIYKEPGKGSIQHLIFGDFVSPPKKKGGGYLKWTKNLTKEVNGKTWIQVRSRQTDGWMRLDDIQLKRVLEVNFVDIGQGDGCHMVTPADEHFIIDAGIGDNMYRFLRWRYNLNGKATKLPKFQAVVSHPDEDHWKGFELLLSKPPKDQKRQIKFDKLYHNGIVQRTGSSIGNVVEGPNGKLYLEEFILNQGGVIEVLDIENTKSRYETFLIKALENFPDLKLETTWKDLKKKNIMYKDEQMFMEVVAPVPEKINNKLCLQWFDPLEKNGSVKQIGKTKNGHSIVLMVNIGKMKIMLGGDLNSKSADHLMEQYGKCDIRQLRIDIENAKGNKKISLQKQLNNVIEDCRKIFQAEIAKSCHHGSHDITNEFMQAINPIATVISSGDEESHCHPRPETLGAIGKFSRGDRPLIYSTELARSSKEFIEINTKLLKGDKVKQKIVTTYGMISVRTDGKRAIICQKLEKNRSQFGLIVKWHIDKLVWNDERGEFVTL